MRQEGTADRKADFRVEGGIRVKGGKKRGLGHPGWWYRLGGLGASVC